MSIFLNYGNFKSFIKRCPVTSFFMLVNTVLFILSIIMADFSFSGDKFTEALVDLGGLAPVLVFAYKEYYRLLVTLFLHGSVLHYLFNTFFGLMVVCAGLEKLIGSWRYFLVYIITGLFSSVVVLYTTGDYTLTIGASGAIYGVMGIFLYVIFFKRHLLSIVDQKYIISLVAINLLFTFLWPSISIVGHLGGLAGGLILAPLLLIKE
ncbi:MAG TPA: rhomboid family intramembrane serine protease [Haloplasmataceae bacterium]